MYNNDDFTTSDSFASVDADEHHYLVATWDEGIASAEAMRLIRQSEGVTAAIEDLFPDGFVPTTQSKLLDIACGPGAWVHQVATSKDVRVGQIIGIDNNKQVIKYARERTAHLSNVSFQLQNIFRDGIPHLNFPDNSFDLVNAGFLAAVLSSNPDKQEWQKFFTEVYRILKPGGYIRLIEGEISTIAYAPCTHRLLKAFMDVLWKSGNSFAEDELAITPIVGRFLRECKFTNVKVHPYALDWSAGETLHPLIVDDTVTLIKTLKFQGALTSIGGITEEEYGVLFEGMMQELDGDDFSALWGIVAVYGYKPLA